MGFCNCSLFCYALFYVHCLLVCNHHDLEERAGCFALFVFMVSRDCCVALPQCAMGLYAVCDCIISDHTQFFAKTGCPLLIRKENRQLPTRASMFHPY